MTEEDARAEMTAGRSSVNNKNKDFFLKDGFIDVGGLNKTNTIKRRNPRKVPEKPD